MKSLAFILIGLIGSFYFTDLESTNVVEHVFAPISVFIFLVYFSIWLIFNAGFGKSSNSSSDISINSENINEDI